MSALSDVFKGIKDVLTGTSGVTDINVHLGAPDAINAFPAVFVTPDNPIDLLKAFSGNSFSGTMRLTVFIRSGDSEDGWRQFWDYLDPVQAQTSITRALRSDPSLNALVDSSQVRQIENVRKADNGVFAFDLLLDYIKSVA
mgnify:CR=1 FL=1